MNAAEPGDGIAAAFVAAHAGNIPAAIAIYRRLLEAAPDDPNLHYALGQLLLLSGDFAAGWDECEKRPQRSIPLPRWRGEAIGGAGILIHGEQGFGDNFQFVRYAAQVAGRGGTVTVATREGLRGLLSTVPGVTRVVEPGEAVAGVAWQAPMLSLPHLFGTRLDSIPAAVPYIAADPERVRAWRGRLDHVPGLRVGLVWSGNTEAPYNLRRSPGLAAFAPLFACTGVAFFALQLGGGRADLAGARLPANFADLGPELRSFDDTAAAMMALDLVITPCTSTAHLAGALARPVWIPLARFPDWRWLLDRDTSPWYPSARLFRQETADDWSAPVARMAAALDRLARGC